MIKKIKNKKGKIFKIYIDREDEILFNSRKWSVNIGRNKRITGLRGWISSKKVYFHKLIIPNKGIIDHINGNPLDNRKVNLRFVSFSENSMNRKNIINKQCKSKGVTKVKSKWRARIFLNKKHIHLGYYKSEKEAAVAYDFFAIKYFGKFAKTNKILGLL